MREPRGVSSPGLSCCLALVLTRYAHLVDDRLAVLYKDAHLVDDRLAVFYKDSRLS